MEIKGYTYGYIARKGMYSCPQGVDSRIRLMNMGINWVCLAFSVKQTNFFSTEIKFDYRYNIPDLELMETIDHFHSKGIKVCLKPMIDCEDGVWRAQIDFPETMRGEDSYWKKWFESYTAFLSHYAQLAEYKKCEMFCLGCEMLGTERKEDYWRATIGEIRKIYSGKLTYNTNHGKEEAAKWYDLIDYVGTSAYYPVADEGGAGVEEMTARWTEIADRLESVSHRLGKPILFMEIGCRSAKGCATMPWDFTHRDLERSEEEQANFYESALKVFSVRDWFAGFFWWDWSTWIYDSPEKAAEDRGFNIHMKKAEEIVRRYYTEA